MLTKTKHRALAEPFKIKMVELVHVKTKKERLRAIKQAGCNTFLLKSDEMYIDLLTDSGTSAMSDYRWTGMMMGDKAYAGSKSFYHFEEAVRNYYGYKYIIPTHQVRGAEHTVSRIMIKPGDYIPGNMYFTATKLHQEVSASPCTGSVPGSVISGGDLHRFRCQDYRTGDSISGQGQKNGKAYLSTA